MDSTDNRLRSSHWQLTQVVIITSSSEDSMEDNRRKDTIWDRDMVDQALVQVEDHMKCRITIRTETLPRYMQIRNSRRATSIQISGRCSGLT